MLYHERKGVYIELLSIVPPQTLALNLGENPTIQGMIDGTIRK